MTRGRLAAARRRVRRVGALPLGLGTAAKAVALVGIGVGTALGTALGTAADAEGLRPHARPATLTLATLEAARDAEAGIGEENGAGDGAGAGAVPVAAPPIRPTDVIPVSAPAGPNVGPETNLPLPRYVSLKTSEANVRRGPSLSHRIDWVFLRRDMPLQVVAEYGHWRRVIDREGLGGWVHYSLLSGVRTVIVDQDLLPIRASADEGAPEIAELETGVVARLGECAAEWCRISAGGYRGWAPRAALWGVGEGEVRD